MRRLLEDEDMPINTQTIGYRDGETERTGLLVWDDSLDHQRPGILVVHGRGSAAFPGGMALPDGVAAVARLGQLAVWSDACLGVHAPEQTVVAGRNSSVALGINEEPLPAKRGTQVRVTRVETLALGFRNHAPPPL